MASLIRTQALPPRPSHSTTLSRAAAFGAGTTASSISRITASTPDAADWSKSSVFIAFTSSQERAISAGMLR